MNKIEKYEINKKNFFELYEKAKNNKIDINTVPNEIYKKMCTLLEEEIKIKKRAIAELKSKLNAS